ncbi:hypothetical protein LZ32DRAFT_358846 [Colletotrichum eremochloae]|nr:hypothetical protein LZ32DRAFT_358846 [Colletotrichum eremochloae]
MAAGSYSTWPSRWRRGRWWWWWKNGRKRRRVMSTLINHQQFANSSSLTSSARPPPPPGLPLSPLPVRGVAFVPLKPTGVFGSINPCPVRLRWAGTAGSFTPFLGPGGPPPRTQSKGERKTKRPLTLVQSTWACRPQWLLPPTLSNSSQRVSFGAKAATLLQSLAHPCRPCIATLA